LSARTDPDRRLRGVAVYRFEGILCVCERLNGAIVSFDRVAAGDQAGTSGEGNSDEHEEGRASHAGGSSCHDR